MNTFILRIKEFYNTRVYVCVRKTILRVTRHLAVPLASSDDVEPIRTAKRDASRHLLAEPWKNSFSVKTTQTESADQKCLPGETKFIPAV